VNIVWCVRFVSELEFVENMVGDIWWLWYSKDLMSEINHYKPTSNYITGEERGRTNQQQTLDAAHQSARPCRAIPWRCATWLRGCGTPPLLLSVFRRRHPTCRLRPALAPGSTAPFRSVPPCLPLHGSLIRENFLSHLVTRFPHVRICLCSIF
jgi:hypothetical protein